MTSHILVLTERRLLETRCLEFTVVEMIANILDKSYERYSIIRTVEQ